MHACMRACMCVCVVCAYGDAWRVGPYEEHRSSSQEHCPLLRQCLSWWSAAHQWSWAWLPGPCGFCLPISGVGYKDIPTSTSLLPGPRRWNQVPVPVLAKQVLCWVNHQTPSPPNSKTQCFVFYRNDKRTNSQGSALSFSPFCWRYVQKPHFIDHSLPRAPFTCVAVLPAPQIFN